MAAKKATAYVMTTPESRMKADAMFTWVCGFAIVAILGVEWPRTRVN